MGFRFRKSFKVFPGCRLNLGKRGFSVSVGGRGSTINISGRGVRATVGIPGTGLSYSGYIAGGNSGSRKSRGGDMPLQTVLNPLYDPPEAIFGGDSIESAPIDTLTSESLEPFRDMIRKVREERASARELLSQTEKELQTTCIELAKRKKSLFRFFYKRKIAALAAALEELEDRKAQVTQILDDLHVKMSFGAFEHTRNDFEELERAFLSMSACGRVWDITATRPAEKGRTAASHTMARERVCFTLSENDELRFEKPALRLQNANGGDIIIYPGFALIQENESSFAILDLRDLEISAGERFTMEDQTIPDDGEIVDQRWLKENKDGTPDRRFRANRQIPVCRYGELNITSCTGVCERYLVSRADAALDFANAFTGYLQSLHKAAELQDDS